MQCCGGALDRVGHRDGSLDMARRKLRDLTEHEVDALVVVCPNCFQQFDLNQAALQRLGEEVDIPTFYISELLALCYGHAPEEIGLGMHRVSVDGFLERWEEREEGRARARQSFDLRAARGVRLLPRLQGRLPRRARSTPSSGPTTSWRASWTATSTP